ncbi:hypothetical protein [Singulisphaera sp. PoT]|uniref:hypothetical protein n=1 Tax=Singulisphaera sp. PoT TaxID=3411797 RepID=UPI003BF5237B
MSVNTAAAAATRSRARVRFNAAMKLVRRAHMYAGLSLVPFVTLYGVTAFLFNHPDWFSDRTVRLITAKDVAGTALATFPTPAALAEQVVSAINREAPSPVKLSDSQAPSYSRDLALTARTGDTEQVIFVELEGRVGTVRSAPIEKPFSMPAWTQRASYLDVAPATQARDAVSSIMTKWGEAPKDIKIRTPAELIFAVESEGRNWRVAYNLQNQGMVATPTAPSLSSRRFLTGLHLACRYPSQVDARWF